MRKIAAIIAAVSIIVSTCPVSAGTVTVDYDSYSTRISGIENKLAQINSLLDQCADADIVPDYDIMRGAVVERYLGYLKDEVANGVSYRSTENGYSQSDVESIYEHNIKSLNAIADEAISNLNAYLEGTKTPLRVPDVITSDTVIDGKTVKAMTETDGKTEERKVFLNGFGHYTAYNHLDFFKETGNNLIQMGIGISAYMKPKNGIADWITGYYEKPDATFELTTEEKRHGSKSVKITNNTERKENYYLTLTQAVKVEPNTRYTFRFYAKGTNIRNFVYKTYAGDTFNRITYDEPVTLTKWTKYEVTYTTGAEQTIDRVYLDTEGKTDVLYIDDVGLYKEGSTINLLSNGGFENADDEDVILDADNEVLWNLEEKFKKAEAAGIKIDLLLEMHYFVWELAETYPDILETGDSFGFRIGHEAAIKACTQHAKIISEIADKYQCINSICLANEPRTNPRDGGDESYYKEAYGLYLEDVYGTIDFYNSVNNTSYTSFSQIPFHEGAMSSSVDRKVYDYNGFADKVGTDWIETIATTVDAITDIPVHVKQMSYVAWSDEGDKRWLIGIGFNPQKYLKFTDINGNDGDLRILADYTGDLSSYMKSKAVQQSMWYDFLTSIKDAPVFNSEDHVLANGDKIYRDEQNKLIDAAQWMGAVHGRNMTATWIFDRSPDRAETYESVAYHPDLFENISEINMDLNRLSDEVYAIIESPANIGILYTEISRRYNRNLMNTMYKAYENCLYNGLKPGFIVESQLEKADNYDVIIIPYATYVESRVIDKLKEYVQNGGKLILMGDDCLEKDDFKRDHSASDIAAITTGMPTVAVSTNGSYLVNISEDDLFNTISDAADEAEISRIEVIDNNTGKKVRNVEYFMAEENGDKIISLCNYDWDADKDVSIYIDGVRVNKAVELRSMENVSSDIQLKSYKPILLKVAKEEEPEPVSTSIHSIEISEDRVFFKVTSGENIENGHLCLGVYGADGRLESAAIDKINIDTGETEDFFADSKVSTAGKTVKLMLWDSGYAPITDAEIYNPLEDTNYRLDFIKPESVNELACVKEGLFDGSVTPLYDSEKECITYQATSQNSVILLPERMTKTDFVMEADMTYTKNADHRGYAITLGPVFGYKDGGNFTAMRYNPENGTVVMSNGINGTTYSRYAEKGNGSSIMLSGGETAHLKLIVNDGLMEFFVNDELCYTYYSPDDSRTASSITANQRANNFCKEGRLGFFSNADRTTLTIDNVRVRDIEAEDIPVYSNTYMDTTLGTALKNDFAGISDSFFGSHILTKGNWGTLSYEAGTANGWANTGNYTDLNLSGDYTVDMSFLFKNPLNDSRWFGIVFGMHIKDQMTYYNVAGVRENGQLFIEQKQVAKGGDDVKIFGANSVTGSCIDTISLDKKNPDYDGNTNKYLLNYMPSGYEYSTPDIVNNMRHSMRLEVKGTTAYLTFGGTTISCEIDRNATDGFTGLRAAGTGAVVYSTRIVEK